MEILITEIEAKIQVNGQNNTISATILGPSSSINLIKNFLVISAPKQYPKM